MAAKELPSQDVLRQLLNYDPDTGLFEWKPRPIEMFASKKAFLRWETLFVGKPAFTMTEACGYKVGRIFGSKYKAHRIAWKMHHGADPEEIDHVDGDRSNNKIENLRSVNRRGNSMNRKSSARNTSGVTGVIFHKASRKWLAKIGIGFSHLHLGLFDKFEDAVAARKAAELEHGFHENHGRAA